MGVPSADRRYRADSIVANTCIWDLETGQRRLTMMYLPDDRYVSFSPDGHYTGSRNVERDLVYVVQTDDGVQHTLTPADFAAKYGWKNDPERVRLK